jgi:hypothetical protein
MPMLNCREATRLLSESQDRPLTLKEKASLRLHTAMCSGCRNTRHQMEFIRDAVRQYAQGDSDKNE